MAFGAAALAADLPKEGTRAGYHAVGYERSDGLQGAKPTPQLPISAVVTPLHELGVR
jgi:hypothetical protein